MKTGNSSELLCLTSGQAGECAGHVPSADGAVPGAASPRPQDCLSAEAAAGRSGHHQGPNISPIHGMTVAQRQLSLSQ